MFFFRCRLKCFNKITENEQIEILHKSGDFNSKDEQDHFFQSLIEALPVKTKRSRLRPTEDNGAAEMQPRPSHSVDHASSFNFFVMVGKSRIKVCKKAFLSLHGIGEKRVRRLKELLLMGKSPRDLRGQQNNRKTFPKDFTDMIKDHINSFPVKTSHYASKEIKYLDAKLDIKMMHSLFKEKYSLTDSDCKYSYYYKMYKEHFNYRFGRPQIDTCCECEQLSVRLKNPQLNDTAKRVAAAQLLVHKSRSNKFYNSLRNTKEYCTTHENALLLCFDYMQNISLPTIPVQEMYYLRQLSVLPFGVHNAKNETATFYLYHEGVAQKGSNEVCTFLLRYINDNVPSTVDELYLYSDNCTGQNKNHAMIRFLMSLTDSGRFKKVVYRLPIRGHSYLPCDRDFGLVKRKLRKQDRYYTVKEVASMILSSTKQGKFMVDLVQTEDILDFQKWWPQFYKKTTASEESKKEKKGKREFFTVSVYHEFIFGKSRKGEVSASDFIDGIQRKTFQLISCKSDLVSLPTQRAYEEKKPIREEKINDLKKVLHYVPSEHSWFYNELLQWPTKKKD